MPRRMSLEEAMVYVLSSAGHGMTTGQIAFTINQYGLHTRADGRPVRDGQVYAAVCRNPSTFVKEGGRILLAF